MTPYDAKPTFRAPADGRVLEQYWVNLWALRWPNYAGSGTAQVGSALGG